MDKTYILPDLGTVKAHLMSPLEQTYTRSERIWVLVKVFKFDSIRQEAYWVTKSARSFKNTELAQAYIQRTNKTVKN